MPADPDEAALAALGDYDLGQVLRLEPLPAGQPTARKVSTATGSYLLKPASRPADVELQARIAGPLTARGIRQPRVIPTASGSLVTAAGLFLQEFLPGAIRWHPRPGQIAATMRNVAAFHLALGELDAVYQPDLASVWVRVTDPGFLVTELPGLLSRYELADERASAAVRYLSGAAADLAALPRQLVHGDIGPDNVLMNGNEVVAIVDFTPHLLPVLLAASTALYWYHVCGNTAVSAGELRASLAELDSVRPWTEAELALWPAGLVWEALRRLATPLELARLENIAPGPSAGPRLAAVRAVMRLLPDGPGGLANCVR